jgi:hypothetical protein
MHRIFANIHIRPNTGTGTEFGRPNAGNEFEWPNAGNEYDLPNTGNEFDWPNNGNKFDRPNNNFYWSNIGMASGLLKPDIWWILYISPTAPVVTGIDMTREKY